MTPATRLRRRDVALLSMGAAFSVGGFGCGVYGWKSPVPPMLFFTWDANAAWLAVSGFMLARRVPVRAAVLGGVCSAMTLATVLFQAGFVGARSPLYLLHSGGDRTAYADVGTFVLHYVTPVVAVAFWLSGGGRGRARRRLAVIWLAFPLAYAVSVTLWCSRGTAPRCPYPFLDVGAIGVPAVIRNCLIAGLVALVINGCLLAAAP